MTITGLDRVASGDFDILKNRRVAVLCHAASVDKNYNHILDIFYESSEFKLTTIFGPQHGLYGQTQDNMVEWESGELFEKYGVTLYSLYGENRKPTSKMLDGVEVFVVDLQDVGARPYTYIWTVKLCIEACSELGIPVVILDRPNPISQIPFDGALLNKSFFTFVGGAEIPLCHRMTLGEMAMFLKADYFPEAEIEIIELRNWNRDMSFADTKLPWVLPSPNMPTVDTALVYPGQVLFEALTLSEGRGTTKPFELFGTPNLNVDAVIAKLNAQKLAGVIFRRHDFIPTFQKHAGVMCGGISMHITEPKKFLTVFTTAKIIEAILKVGDIDNDIFIGPPYEYEYKNIPFDSLSGDTRLRDALILGDSLECLKTDWESERKSFIEKFNQINIYGEVKS